MKGKNEVYTERIVSLIEDERFFLSKGFNLECLSNILMIPKIKAEVLIQIAYNASFEEVVEVCRICYARKILLEQNVPFSTIWKHSGFSSFYRFKKMLAKYY